jgi:hypothetical protein
MQLQVGKRYVMRNGQISGIMMANDVSWGNLYQFQDESGATWTKDGIFLVGGIDHNFDLMSEAVIEQDEEPKAIGLTDDEKALLTDLGGWFSRFLTLPDANGSRAASVVCDAVNVIQKEIAMRVARRACPDVFLDR